MKAIAATEAAANKLQVFRLLLDPDPDVLLWVLHPFALARLTPQRIDVRLDQGSASPALNVTAQFADVGDAEALSLVGHVLKTPRVRAATVETVVLRANDTGY
jgi:hypothetical protein